MIQIPKSKIRGMDFDTAVAAFVGKMNAWRKHMANVGLDPDNHVPFPRPQTHPLVASVVTAVGEGQVESYAAAEYEIVDDGPPPAVILRARKDQLLGHVSRLETEASAAVVPAGKRRFLSIRENDIRKVDGERRTAHAVAETDRRAAAFNALPEKKRNDHEAVAKALGPVPTEEDLDKKVAADREADDTDFLAAQADRHARLDAIARHAAKLHHDIEDLTEDTVDKWTPEPFPT